MQLLSDKRRLRVIRVKTAMTMVVAATGADIWQDKEGHLHTSGLWDGLVPIAPEDIEIQARRQSISPLEWMRIRLLACSGVRVEVVQ